MEHNLLIGSLESFDVYFQIHCDL